MRRSSSSSRSSRLGASPGPLSRALLLVLLVSSPAVSLAADPTVPQRLEQAEQSLTNLDYDAANAAAARLVEEHGLSHIELVHAYRILAFTDAVLGKDAAARDAFQRLLVCDPGYQVDANLSPKVYAPFVEARGFMRAQAVEPGIDVAVTLRPTEPGAIRVTTRDPTQVAKRAVVSYRWGGDGEFSASPIAIAKGAAVDVPPPPQGTTRLDYYVQVFDERDSVVFESGNPLAPKSATVDLNAAPVINVRVGASGPAEPERPRSHSVLASPVFWTITGVVLAGATIGIYFAARPGNKTIDLPGPQAPATGATLLPSLQCGATACN